MTARWWAARANMAEIRSALRDLRDEARIDPATYDDAMATMRGRYGRCNFIEAGGWEASPDVQAAMQDAFAAHLDQTRRHP